MPVSGMCILRRFSPLIATIASRSAESSRQAGTRLSTAGMVCVLNLSKPVSLISHLHVRLGNRMVLGALGLLQKFFRAESNPKMCFGCIAHDLKHYRENP